MNKKALAIAKINFKNIKALYWLIGGIIAAMAVQSVVLLIILRNNHGYGSELSLGNFLWLLIALTAIIIPARNFRRIVNLGGKRDNFLTGSLLVYVIMAAASALISTTLHFTIEPLFENHAYFDPYFLGGIANFAEIFRWADNGFIVAVLQQFAFLLLLAAFLHTLTAMQDRWFGWAADVAIVAIISVFTPIAPLRAALVWFFNLILFGEPWLQIPACLIIACGIYALNKPLLARKAI